MPLHSFQHLWDMGQAWVWASGLGPLAGDRREEELGDPLAPGVPSASRVSNVTELQKPGGPRDTQGIGVRV